MEQSARSNPPDATTPDHHADVIPMPGVELAEPEPAEPEVTVRWTRAPGKGTRMTGGIVRDPAEVAAIRRRVHGRAENRGAWRRVLRRIRWGR